MKENTHYTFTKVKYLQVIKNAKKYNSITIKTLKDKKLQYTTIVTMAEDTQMANKSMEILSCLSH